MGFRLQDQASGAMVITHVGTTLRDTTTSFDFAAQ
jgi:hypothetical protein